MDKKRNAFVIGLVAMMVFFYGCQFHNKQELYQGDKFN